MSVLNYGLFASKYYFDLFVFLGDWSLALSVSVGVFRTSGFRLIFVSFLIWPRGVLLRSFDTQT